MCIAIKIVNIAKNILNKKNYIKNSREIQKSKRTETIELSEESEKDKNSKIFAKIAVYSWKEGKRRIKGEEYFNYTTRAYDLKYCPSCR